MPSKLSLLIQLNTVPTDLGAAQAHIAGWSETVWNNADSTGLADITALAIKRAQLLPTSARIIGYRQQVFQLDGAKLLPGGTSSGALALPGTSNQVTDLPQVALLIKSSNNVSANTRTWTIRGVPDDVMSGGEYQPGPGYKGKVTTYLNQLRDGPWYFVARSLTAVQKNVVSIANNLLTTNGALAVGVGDYVRLLKVKDVNGRLVSGSFPVTALVGALGTTLGGLPAGLVVGTSGKARLDTMVMRKISDSQVSRAVVKKVGRPFEQYRGRRSKRS